MLFDAHCDTAYEMFRHSYGLYENPGHTDLRRGLELMPYAQFYAIFALPGEAEIFERELNWLLSEIEFNAGRVSLCRTAKEAGAAADEGRAAAFISVEGAELLGCSIDGLEKAWEKGVRAVNLTWNEDNELAGAAATGNNLGLTQKGREFVRAANELGVIIDVSHLSERAFWDICEVTDAPFMASHSNSKAICPHFRNLTDAQFCEIARRGGAVGLNLYTGFLGGNSISDVVSHFERFISLGGEKTLALGSDLDGCDSLPEGINGIQDMLKLRCKLSESGYGDTLLDDVFYNNLMRLVERICGI
ncbi:MAG: dipeptidase [Oscillospiraceae bacterium]|jgi:membrane dipeptidase